MVVIFFSCDSRVKFDCGPKFLTPCFRLIGCVLALYTYEAGAPHARMLTYVHDCIDTNESRLFCGTKVLGKFRTRTDLNTTRVYWYSIQLRILCAEWMGKYNSIPWKIYHYP